ncbi:hypothetical protein QYF61_023867 [Mycteria americana]|uniref:Uncharacterized protein n=1 Tax=Mycteria americana TaxID=33587 RepID=A0AAN7S9W3_MYCAM|nr:hypothetical protein QYF61_023867 [Mycteria americana]
MALKTICYTYNTIVVPVLGKLFLDLQGQFYCFELPVKDTIGFLGCKCTLLAHVQFFIHQYPQGLLPRAALNPFIPHSVLILGIALTQVQNLALGLVELHEVHRGPLLKPVKVPLDGIPSLRNISCTTRLGVIPKIAESALNPIFYYIEPLTATLCTSPSSQFLIHLTVHP